MKKVIALTGLVLLLLTGIAQAFDMQQAINEINRALHAIRPPIENYWETR